MNLSSYFKLLGYVTSFLMVGFGLIFMTGAFNLFNVKSLPSNFRVMFGIVFMLYGIFRFVRLIAVKKDYSERDS